MSMSISPVNSYSALNLQRISSLLQTTTKAATSDINSLISSTLSSQKGSSAQSAQKTDGLSMLQQLMGYINTKSTDPVFDIGTSSEADNDSDFDSFLNITGKPLTSDSLNSIFDQSDPTGDIYSKLMNIQGIDSGSNQSFPVYDSNFALLQALQKSGMKSEQITDVMQKVQNSTQYTNQGFLNSSTDSISGLFSAIA